MDKEERKREREGFRICDKVFGCFGFAESSAAAEVCAAL